MKKIVIFTIVFMMVFSPFILTVSQNAGIPNNIVPKDPLKDPLVASAATVGSGGGSSQEISAELNYSPEGIVHTFDRIEASISHTEFDVGQSVTIHFSNSYLCATPVSGMPANSTGQMIIEELSPTVKFLPSHWANVSYDPTDSAGGPATTYANFTESFTSPIVFTFFVEAHVDDTQTGVNYTNSSALIQINVNSDPTVTLSSNQSVSGYVDTNTSIKFTANALGGWVPYTYQYYINGVVHTSSSDFRDESFQSPGSYAVYVEVSDATGYTVSSNTISEQVAYPPKVNISSSQTRIDANQPVEFFSNLIHGNGQVTITWYINGTEVSGQTGRDLNESFKGPGRYDIRVTAKDQAGYVVSSNMTEIVYPPISSNLFVSSDHFDIGQKGFFRLNLSGSSGEFNASYELSTCVAGTIPTRTILEGTGTEFNFTFPNEYSGGQSVFPYPVKLTWKIVSSIGEVSYENDSAICVHGDPQISISEDYTSRDAGVGVHFTSSSPSTGGDNGPCAGAYKGWEPYHITWQYENISIGEWENITTTFGNYSSSSGDYSGASYAFNLAGNYEIRAHLIDGVGYQVNSSEISLTIYHKLRIIVTVSPNKVIDMHNPALCGEIYIYAQGVGGTDIQPDCFKFDGNAAQPPFECNPDLYRFQKAMPQNPGEYEYSVSDSDQSGGYATGYGNFTVLANDMSITTNLPSVVITGNSYSLSASASAPSLLSFAHSFNLIGYSYEWHIGTSNKSGENIVFDFSRAGTFSVNLTVKAIYETDYGGQEVQAYQEKNITESVRVVNSSTSTNIHIKQFRYSTPTNYYFLYWVSFVNSSYSESFYSINNTSYSINTVQSYPNGSVSINISIQDSDYSPGTHDIYFTVINNESQTNTVNSSFYVSLAQSDQISIYTIANFFGGYYNFLIFLATMGALVIGYLSLRESKEPPIIQVKGSNGKTESYRINGKKVK